MKVAVFLDYANIAASARQRNYNVDYGALLDYLADEDEGRTLQVAYAYVPIDLRQEYAMDATIKKHLLCPLFYYIFKCLHSLILAAVACD